MPNTTSAIFCESKRPMSRHHKKREQADAASASSSDIHSISLPSSPDLENSNTPFEPAIKRAMPHAAAGHYEKALSILATGGNTPPVLNARGVCLLRLGRYEEA